MNAIEVLKAHIRTKNAAAQPQLIKVYETPPAPELTGPQAVRVEGLRKLLSRRHNHDDPPFGCHHPTVVALVKILIGPEEAAKLGRLRIADDDDEIPESDLIWYPEWSALHILHKNERNKVVFSMSDEDKRKDRWSAAINLKSGELINIHRRRDYCRPATQAEIDREIDSLTFETMMEMLNNFTGDLPDMIKESILAGSAAPITERAPKKKKARKKR